MASRVGVSAPERSFSSVQSPSRSHERVTRHHRGSRAGHCVGCAPRVCVSGSGRYALTRSHKPRPYSVIGGPSGSDFQRRSWLGRRARTADLSPGSLQDGQLRCNRARRPELRAPNAAGEALPAAPDRHFRQRVDRIRRAQRQVLHMVSTRSPSIGPERRPRLGSRGDGRSTQPVRRTRTEPVALADHSVVTTPR